MKIIKYKNFERHAWKLFILPALILSLVVGIGPLLYSLYISTFQYNMAKSTVSFKFIGLDNFLTLLKSGDFWNSIGLTVLFVIIVVTVEIVLGTLLALLLVGDIKGKSIFRSIFLVPMIISPLVVGLIGRFIFEDSVGIVNNILRLINIPTIIWYGDSRFALMTMILLDIWEWTPFVFLIILAGIMAIPNDFYDAAKVEGASPFGELFRITIPTLKGVYLLAILIRLIDSFREFDKIYIMTTGGPANATNLLAIYNYRIAFKEFNIGLGSALSIIILIIMVLLGSFLVKTLKSK